MNISQATIVHVTIIAQGFWTSFSSFYIKKTIKSILKFYNSLITSMPIIPKFAVYIFLNDSYYFFIYWYSYYYAFYSPYVYEFYYIA